MKEDAPEPGRLSLATAMAFALAVAAARGETAVAGLLAGILALAEDGRLDEIDSRVAWAPQFLWGEQSDNSERRPVVHLETAGVDGLPAALVASHVLARGRGRLGIGTGPIEARHLEMVDALVVALSAAVEAGEPSVATALSIVLEAVASGDAERLAAFFSESDVSGTAN